MFAVGFCLALAGPTAQKETAAIEGQVQAYFNLQLQITVIPSGAQPGKLTPADKTELQQRIVTELPKVATGRLLLTQTQWVYDYYAGLAQFETAIVVVGGAVDSISFDSAPIISGGTATISGSYAYHSDSYHLQDGKRTSDSFSATSSFTAQLARQGEVWLVSSISTTDLSKEPLP